MRRRDIIPVGKDHAESKIHTLCRVNGVPSYQCAWYALGQREKTLAEIESAKFFAQQSFAGGRSTGF